jgi:hypothetical protein
MHNIIIVHGEKPLRSGGMHPAFRERLDEAVRLIHGNNFDMIVITGGRTRKNAPSESEMGRIYLQNKVSIPIIGENQARTTSENVRLSQVLLEDKNLNQVTVITSQKRIRRAQYLYARLWPEISDRIEFVAARDFYPCYYLLLEFLYRICAYLDPYEKTFARLLKKVFRNSAFR